MLQTIAYTFEYATKSPFTIDLFVRCLKECNIETKDCGILLIDIVVFYEYDYSLANKTVLQLFLNYVSKPGA